VASSSTGSQARRTSGRAAVRPPTPANRSLIAPENGDPNGDPIRYQKRSQRVTRHPTGLVGPDVTKRQAQRVISAFGGPKKWWTGGELNSRHRDFQSRCPAFLNAMLAGLRGKRGRGGSRGISTAARDHSRPRSRPASTSRARPAPPQGPAGHADGRQDCGLGPGPGSVRGPNAHYQGRHRARGTASLLGGGADLAQQASCLTAA
jgi:hypothetical protein